MQSYRNSGPRPAIMQGSPPALVVPAADWDRPPWNRWSFQHVREIVPTVEVWKGHGNVRVFPRGDRDLDRLEVTDSRGRACTLIEHLDETYTDGFLVVKDGAIVYERYFNGMTDRTLHLSQSMSKSIVGSVVGILVARGVLDVDAEVTSYLPELDETAWKGATLRQVLDMTTGVRFDETYEDPNSDIGKVDYASGWKPLPADREPGVPWPSNMWEMILSLREMEAPHGESFEYRSIETDVLAFVLERVTGRRLAEIVSEELWQKLGCEESACFTVDRAGYALGDGGFNACLRDYARFGQMVLDGGAGIVPLGWIEQTRNGSYEQVYNASFPDCSYRNQFWIEDAESRNLMCRGVFGQLIHINFAAGIVTVKLSSYPEFSNGPFGVATLNAIHAIAAAV